MDSTAPPGDHRPTAARGPGGYKDMTDQYDGLTRTDLTCFSCRRTATAAEFLDGCGEFHEYMLPGGFVAVARHRCGCGEATHVTFTDGRIVLGYLYATCSINFCPVKYAEAPGLTVGRDGAVLVIACDGRAWRLPHGPAEALATSGACGCG